MVHLTFAVALQLGSSPCWLTCPPTRPALQWFVIDAEGQTLGRVASLAAFYIRGKHLPSYTPSMDMGAYGELAPAVQGGEAVCC